MPYGFIVDSPSYKIYVSWCKREFGSDSHNRWTHRDRRFFTHAGADYGQSGIYFNNEEDAVAFKIKWT